MPDKLLLARIWPRTLSTPVLLTGGYCDLPPIGTLDSLGDSVRASPQLGRPVIPGIIQGYTVLPASSKPVGLMPDSRPDGPNAKRLQLGDNPARRWVWPLLTMDDIPPLDQPVGDPHTEHCAVGYVREVEFLAALAGKLASQGGLPLGERPDGHRTLLHCACTLACSVMLPSVASRLVSTYSPGRGG